jgi:hypothetical protein
MWFRALLAVSVLAQAALVASAQELDWAQKMFEKLSIDFGKVARGAECTYRLKLTNIYKETVFITDVRTSCGCSAAKASNRQILSGESVYIDISMDTLRYMRQKDSNAIIVLSEPTHGLVREVRIPLSVYIRTDVVFTPGSVNFGIVEHGAGSERKVHVEYAGRPDWKIVEVTSSKPYLAAKVQETGRANGQVGYDLLVTLAPDAPVGSLRDQLTLITDDANNPHVPLQVDGRVEAEFTITPEVWVLGNMAPGTTKVQNVVIRGRKPFRIQGIEATTPLEAFKVVLPQDEKQVHVLPLKFVAPAGPVEINELFTITIPGRDEPVTFKAQGKVTAPPSGT